MTTPPIIRLSSHFPSFTFIPTCLSSTPRYIVIEDWSQCQETHVYETDSQFNRLPREKNQVKSASFTLIQQGWIVRNLLFRKHIGQEDYPNQDPSNFFSLADAVAYDMLGHTVQDLNRWKAVFWGSSALSLGLILYVAQRFFVRLHQGNLSVFSIAALGMAILANGVSYTYYRKAALRLALSIASAFDATITTAFAEEDERKVTHHYLPSSYRL